MSLGGGKRTQKPNSTNTGSKQEIFTALDKDNSHAKAKHTRGSAITKGLR